MQELHGTTVAATGEIADERCNMTPIGSADRVGRRVSAAGFTPSAGVTPSAGIYAEPAAMQTMAVAASTSPTTCDLVTRSRSTIAASTTVVAG